MNEAEFDRYAADYQALHRRSIAFSGCEPGYFAEYKADYAAECFRRHCPPEETLLDFGGGTGQSLPYFKKLMPRARLVCADVSSASLELAEARFGAAASYLHIADETLSLPSGSLGMAFAACVFHHIEPERHVSWLAELHRVTRPDGALLVFEHNPLNPLTRHAVASCAFDEDAILIRAGTLLRRLKAAGWRPLRLRYHVFFPGFLASLRPAEKALGWLALGGQYSILARNPQ